MKNNKSYGKVTYYNGVYGNIKDTEGTDYDLLDKNVIDKDIKQSDIVEFEKDEIETPEVEVKIARFVRILKKDK